MRHSSVGVRTSPLVCHPVDFAGMRTKKSEPCLASDRFGGGMVTANTHIADCTMMTAAAQVLLPARRCHAVLVTDRHAALIGTGAGRRIDNCLTLIRHACRPISTPFSGFRTAHER